MGDDTSSNHGNIRHVQWTGMIGAVTRAGSRLGILWRLVSCFHGARSRFRRIDPGRRERCIRDIGSIPPGHCFQFFLWEQPFAGIQPKRDGNEVEAESDQQKNIGQDAEHGEGEERKARAKSEPQHEPPHAC